MIDMNLFKSGNCSRIRSDNRFNACAKHVMCSMFGYIFFNSSPKMQRVRKKLIIIHYSENQSKSKLEKMEWGNRTI